MKKLYKYRNFGIHTLRMLCNSEVYYSDPTIFNDPLDCKPCLTLDISITELEQLCFRMYELEYDQSRATDGISKCRYYSTEYNEMDSEEQQEYYSRLLSNDITNLIHKRMKGRGVLSLAGNWSSPLMWSHYADEHKGICLEYDLKNSIIGDSKAVDYNSDRNLLASVVSDWIYSPSPFNTADVESKYFYTKAKPWEYEEETRYLGKQGVNSAPFHLSGIYFGMRCDPSVISSIVKLMEGSGRDIEFSKIYIVDSSFELLRNQLDADEIRNNSVRPSARLAFSPFTD